MTTFRIPLSSIAKRALLPHHWWKLLQRSTTTTDRAKNDAQLALYSKILGSGFLHYGYFDSPDVSPDDISFRDLALAQQHYASVLLNYLIDRQSPVFDVGCGIGGFANLVREQGFPVVCLTPDGHQAKFIRAKYPNFPLIQSKYEELREEDYSEYFGAVVMSESFQYINLKRAFNLTFKLLKMGGRWLICDYFRVNDTGEKSGHHLEDFLSMLREHPEFELKEVRDITKNVLPTLMFASHFIKNLGIPLVDFLEGKLMSRRPRLYYLLEEVFAEIHNGQENLFQFGVSFS